MSRPGAGPRSAGQATVEWSALALALALVLTAAATVAARSGAAARLGEEVVDAIACAIGDGCPGALESAYGEELARAVREHAPNLVYERRSAQLPIDFRRCRETICANGPESAEDVYETNFGMAVTAFTRVIDRRRSGGPLYIQYWLYFPESFTAGIGRSLGRFSWQRWPGYHEDDWEGFQIRIGPGDAVAARVTAHGRYRSDKDSERWGDWGRPGWYRISGGSHAGHLVERPAGERTTRASELRLIPLETLHATDLYNFEVSPPWRKVVYREPEAESS
jgi:hypothetical protein